MKPTIGKAITKLYKCVDCSHEFSSHTNHWGEIYWCPKCKYGATSECLEDPPEGYGIPPKWEKVSIAIYMKSASHE
jgi:DNA-directed RNA polymerase subunit RPC12/RpoP